MSAKSQFLANNTTTGGVDTRFDTLTLAVTDTRGGFDAATTQLVGNLRVVAEQNGTTERFDNYMAKITPAAKTTATPRATVKPGNGMM